MSFMSSLIEELPKRGALATALSLILHAGVVAGLLYASMNHSVQLPPPQQAINVSLIAPEVQPEQAAKSAPAPVQPPVTPVHEPTPQVEQPTVQPKAAIALEKPKPKPKPVKKVVHKPVPKEKPTPVVHKTQEKPVKPQEKPTDQNNPFAQNNTQQQTHAQSAPQKSPDQHQSISQGKPQRISTVNPAYPARALALHVEGRVQAKFDVDSSGAVSNIEIVSAQPRGMFDREVRQALKRWRYTPGHPSNGQTISIVFRIDGSSSVE